MTRPRVLLLNARLSKTSAVAAMAIALERCNGIIAVVMTAEVERVLTLA